MTEDSSITNMHDGTSSKRPGGASFSVSTNNLEEPSCWFLSISCLDDIAQSFTVTPDRSAFDPYQRPVHVMSLFDASLEEDNDDDEDYEEDTCQDHRVGEDIESSTGAGWPLIERTFSFDDWNMDDEIQVVSPSVFPVVFRFEERSMQQVPLRISKNIVTTSATDDELPTVSFDGLFLSGRSNNRFLEQDCSMRPILPSSDSYFFNPIRGGQSSCNSEGTSAVLTMSIISVETELTTDYAMSYKCRGIPRLASFDDNDHSQNQLFVQVDTDIPFSIKNESPRTQKFTSTNAPIPEFVVVRKQSPKSVHNTLLKSWKKVLRIGRKKRDWSPPSKKTFISNQCRASKGEF